MKFFFLLTTVWFTGAFALAETPMHYCNGHVVAQGRALYYPNGRIAVDDWGIYYPNGQRIKTGRGTFYPHGRKIYDTWGCYGFDGADIPCANPLIVEVPLKNFGTVKIHAIPARDSLGVFEFATVQDGVQMTIAIDFIAGKIVSIDPACP